MSRVPICRLWSGSSTEAVFRRRLIATICVSLLTAIAVTAPAAPAYATNFGSEGNRNSIVSVGNDDIFAVYISVTVDATFEVKIRNKMADTYDSLAHIAMFETTDINLNDVEIYQGTYNFGYIALTDCPTSSSLTGAHPNATCFPARIRYNNVYDHEFDTDPERWALACHEIGHTVGLRHGPDHGATCMSGDTDSALTAVERGHLNNHYDQY